MSIALVHDVIAKNGANVLIAELRLTFVKSTFLKSSICWVYIF